MVMRVQRRETGRWRKLGMEAADGEQELLLCEPHEARNDMFPVSVKEISFESYSVASKDSSSWLEIKNPERIHVDAYQRTGWRGQGGGTVMRARRIRRMGSGSSTMTASAAVSTTGVPHSIRAMGPNRKRPAAVGK